DRIIWDLLRLDRATASCVTGQLFGVRPRFNSIIALSRILKLPQEIEDEANTLQNKSYDVQEKRNRIVHDPWFGYPKSKAPQQFKSRTHKSAEFGLVAVKRDEIMQTLQKIEKRNHAALKLHANVNAALAASGRTQPLVAPELLSAHTMNYDSISKVPGFR